MATSIGKENSNGPPPKRHSPAESSFSRDTTAVLHNMRNFPGNEIINWSKFAWEHGVPNKNNCVQSKNTPQITTNTLTHLTEHSPCTMPSTKLPGGEISIPNNQAEARQNDHQWNS